MEGAVWDGERLSSSEWRRFSCCEGDGDWEGVGLSGSEADGKELSSCCWKVLVLSSRLRCRCRSVSSSWFMDSSALSWSECSS